MANFFAGDLTYHDYGEVPQVVHERLVLGHVDGHEYVIATPDRDIYIEVLDGSIPDLSRFWVGGARGVLPRDIPAANIYGFGAISARHYNRAARRPRRSGPKRLGGSWSRASCCCSLQYREPGLRLVTLSAGHKIGEEIVLAAGAAEDGNSGLHHIVDSEGESRTVFVVKMRESEIDSFCEKRVQLCREAEACRGDLVMMLSRYGVNGERSRTFKDSIQEMRLVEFDDFPFSEYVKAKAKAASNVAESSLAQHTTWVAQSGIPAGDGAIWEDDCLIRILDWAVKFDGLNIQIWLRLSSWC